MAQIPEDVDVVLGGGVLSKPLSSEQDRTASTFTVWRPSYAMSEAESLWSSTIVKPPL